MGTPKRVTYSRLTSSLVFLSLLPVSYVRTPTFPVAHVWTIWTPHLPVLSRTSIHWQRPRTPCATHRRRAAKSPPSRPELPPYRVATQPQGPPFERARARPRPPRAHAGTPAPAPPAVARALQDGVTCRGRGAVNASTPPALRCAPPPLSVVGHREFIVGARRHTRRGH